MYKKLIVAVVLVSLCTSAFAAGFLGPPTAGLKRGQWGTGYNYSYSSQRLDRTTMKWVSQSFTLEGVPSGSPSFWHSELTLRNFDVQRHYWNINYGARDWWELYFQLGLADVKAKAKDEYSSISRWGMNFDNDAAIGWGTRTTFWKGERVSWGTALQMNWLNTHWKKKSSEEIDEGYFMTSTETADLRTWDLLLSLGPKIDVGTWWLYGGPFYYYLSGKIDRQRTDVYPQCHIAVEKGHADLEASHIGGFLGAQFDLTQRISTILEYAFTGNGWAVGTGILVLLN